MFVIPALTLAISLGFAAQLLNRYRSRGKSHQLAWGLALLFYAIAAFPEMLGSITGWTEFDFRVYYLFGAILLVPWLALGTAELLLPAGQARLGYRAFVGVVTALGVVTVLIAPLHGSHLGGTLPPDNCTMWCKSESGFALANGLATLGAAVGNATGTVVLVVGALYSAYRTLRAGAPRNLFVGNVVIAAGAIVPASISTLTRVGSYQFFYAGQLIGIAVIFAGFLIVAGVPRVSAQPA